MTTSKHVIKNGISSDPYAIKADKVITPLDAEYDNARFDQFAGKAGSKSQSSAKLSPSIIVYCSTEEQVIHVIQFAKEHDYKVTCRSGGHSYAGKSSSSLPRSIQIDLSAMKKMKSLKNHMIEVEPGVKLRELIKFLIPRRLSFPHGMCKNVGLGGHLQSSAYGSLSASYGSGLDYVLSFRIVLANGKVETFSQNDKDPTFYKAILGSAPGSWGVITQYTVKGIPNSECPHSRAILKKYPYNKELLVKMITLVDSMLQYQEEKNLRDLTVLLNIGHFPSLFDLFPDLPLIGGLDKWFNLESDKKNYITLTLLWTGIDSGKMKHSWAKAYMDLFDQLHPLPFPSSLNVPLPLSLASSMAVTFKYPDYRYHVASICSDYYWKEEFIELLANEFDECTKIPNSLLTWQYVPAIASSQFRKNKGMNALSWRDLKAYLDPWIFFKDDQLADEIAERMRHFCERTEKFWVWKNGLARHLWMSPKTIYDNAGNLLDETVAQKYYPDPEEYHRLRVIKGILDPDDMFHNDGTIPPLNR